MFIITDTILQDPLFQGDTFAYTCMESVYNCSSDEFAYSRGLIEFKEHLYR